MTSPIVVTMASHPPRQAGLRRRIDELLPQADHLLVYLNRHITIPDFLRHEKIRVEIGGPYLKDLGKYAFDVGPDAYHFLLDDDVAVPPDYCQTLVRRIDHYGKNVIVGVVGWIFPEIPTSYWGPALERWELIHPPTPSDCVVTQVSSCAAAYHTSRLRLDASVPHLLDELDSDLVMLAQRNIHQVLIAYPPGWVRADPIAWKDSLGHEIRNDLNYQERRLRRLKELEPILTPPMLPTLPGSP